MTDKQQAAEIAAAVVSEAHVTAEKVTERAAQTAENVLKAAEVNQEMVDVLSQSLREVFGENEEAQRFIDVKRIPLICKSILDMHDNIKELKENQTWAVRVVIGAVILGVIAMLIKH